MDSARHSYEEIMRAARAGSALGEGAHGRVYAALWQGMPAALKIISTAVAHQELRINARIKSIKQHMPPEAAGILPDIYEAEFLQDCGGYLLMEQLEPLGDAASERLFAPLCGRSRAEQRACLGNDRFLDSIVKSLYEVSSNVSLVKSVVSRASSQLRSRGIPETYDGACVQRIAEEAARDIPGAQLEQARHLSNLAVTRIAGAKSIPANPLAIHLCDEAGASVRLGLSALLKHGIAWGDLHECNLMSRHGQPVLIDFAEYDFISS